MSSILQSAKLLLNKLKEVDILCLLSEKESSASTTQSHLSDLKNLTKCSELSLPIEEDAYINSTRYPQLPRLSSAKLPELPPINNVLSKSILFEPCISLKLISSVDDESISSTISSQPDDEIDAIFDS